MSIRPGINIDVKSNSSGILKRKTGGTVLLPLEYSFGIDKQVVEIFKESDIDTKLGGINDETIIVREILKNANKVIVYKVNTGTSATFKVSDDFLIKTKQTGEKANLVSVKVDKLIDKDKLNVKTFFKNQLVCNDIIDKSVLHYENQFITYKGKIDRTSGIFLTGASTLPSTNESYVEFFDAAFNFEFDVICIPIDNYEIKSLALSFIKRMRDTEGKKMLCVVCDYDNADYEGMISVKNGVILNDGYTINNSTATGFISGLTANSLCNKSNTYETYTDAYDTDIKYNNSEIEEHLLNGHLIFTKLNDKVIIEKDINTFTSFSPEKNEGFSKNRVVRVIDEVKWYIKELFLTRYIGKVSNNNDGRLLFKGDVINYLNTLNEMGAILDFDVTNDIIVKSGDSADSINCTINIKPIDSIEKMTIIINV